MGNVFVGRVLSEDADFMVIEVGKHDQVSWRIAPVPGEENPAPPQFFTIGFLKKVRGGASLWNPFSQEESRASEE
jgi:hypothetical protein